jgi:NitT/TauT family transport system permease protein
MSTLPLAAVNSATVAKAETQKPHSVDSALPAMLRVWAERAFWWVASVGIFVGVWEFCWWRGYADPLMLPPPHLFLANLTEQFRFFDPAGARSLEEEGGGFVSVLIVMGWTSMRVILGLALGFFGAVAIGVGIRYFHVFGKLTLPTITLLTPISPRPAACTQEVPRSLDIHTPPLVPEAVATMEVPSALIATRVPCPSAPTCVHFQLARRVSA